MGQVNSNEIFRDRYILLGLKVAFYRKKAGLMQEALADAAGVSWSLISQMESNNRQVVKGVSLNTLFKIADVLGVSASKFLEE